MVHNLDKRIKEDERLARGAAQLRADFRGAHAAEWATRIDRKSGATKEMSAQRARMERELAMANAELRTVRQARLRTLLHQERLQYERELNARGLAVLHDD
jgi:hypothetical protein